MEIFLILIGIIVASFVVGLIMKLSSSEDTKSFSVFEITKNGFYSISLVALIIAFIIISFM